MCSILLGYSFKPKQSCACYRGLGYDHRFINKWILALKKTSLTKENKIDWSTSLGCGDLKGLMQFRQSFPFSSFVKKTKLKEACRVLFAVKN